MRLPSSPCACLSEVFRLSFYRCPSEPSARRTALSPLAVTGPIGPASPATQDTLNHSRTSRVLVRTKLASRRIPRLALRLSTAWRLFHASRVDLVALTQAQQGNDARP